MKIVTVVGARPQFIKAAAVSRAFQDHCAGRVAEVLVHTGQHYDENMSKVFFDELQIPAPGYNLAIAGGQHGEMTGRMLEAIEHVLLNERPDSVLVYGDTNSTLAAALAAVKLHIPVAHVEAGLRSFNLRMPEEVNRILADRISTLLFCPTKTAVEHLRGEGITQGVHLVGDVMFDVSLHYRELARTRSDALERLQLREGKYILATCHRAENTDDLGRMEAILGALAELAENVKVVLPLHPRTHKIVEQRGLARLLKKIRLVEPLSYIDMVRLEQSARVIITDSGGVQKEAFFYGVPCITMRDETEWVETLHSGWNQLVGADRARIIEAAQAATAPADAGECQPYGSGAASRAIVDLLVG